MKKIIFALIILFLIIGIHLKNNIINVFSILFLSIFAFYIYFSKKCEQRKDSLIKEYEDKLEDLNQKKDDEIFEKNELYRIAVESFDGYIYICSDDYIIKYMNEPFIKRTGRDATGEKCYKALHDLEKPCSFCVNDQVQKGETVRWETKSPKDNKWYYIVNTPLYRKDGSIWKYAFIIDVTEKKEINEILKKKELEYRQLIENQEDLIVRVDKEMSLKYCSKKFVKLFPDYSDFEEFIRPNFEKVKKDNSKHEKMIINQEIKKRNQRVFLNWKIIPMEKIEDYLIVGRDITQIKKAEQLKAEFLGNVSHEIRTPMTSIVGYSYLAEKTSEKEKRNRYLTKISISSERLLLLLNDIIDLSRIEAGDVEINKELFSVNELFSEIYSRFKKEAEFKENTELIFTFLKDDIIIESDREKIIKVISNLLSNSFKFTESGFIRVGFNVENNNLIITVSDSGIGIPESKIGEIFKNFSQVDASRTRKFGGTGIGLSITGKFVDLLGGDVKVSSFEGKGSTFEVNIPVNAECLQVEDVNEKQDEKTHNILIVEDQKEIAIMLEEVFIKENVIVNLESDGESAVKYLKENTPDLILLDIELPGMDGFEVVKNIKKDKNTMNIPVIAMTAYANEIDREECIENGFSDYIAKPFNLNHIISKVRNYL